MELVDSTLEDCEPIKVGCFIKQYANWRMLELYYNFFDKLCDVNKFEELEMNKDSLYLALAEEDLHKCILPSKRAQRNEKRSKDCRDDFKADSENIFFPVLAALNIRNISRQNQDCSNRSSDVTKCCVYVVKLIAVTIVKVGKISLAVKERINAH